MREVTTVSAVHALTPLQIPHLADLKSIPEHHEDRSWQCRIAKQIHSKQFETMIMRAVTRLWQLEMLDVQQMFNTFIVEP